MKNLTPQQRDKQIYELEQFENSLYKKTILAIEKEIADRDTKIKELTKDIHKPNLHSPGDLRNMRINRRKLKKERENLRLKLDLMRK